MMTSPGFGGKSGAFLILLCFIFSSCFTPHTAYNHSGDFNNLKSSVELTNKKAYTGYLSLSGSASHAVLHSTDFNKSLTLNTNDIVAIKNDFGYFERKTLKSHHGTEHNKTSKAAFVKRLTEEAAYVHVYEHQEIINNPKSSLPVRLTKFYIALPGSAGNEVWDLDAEQFNKHFNRKMEELFAADKKLVSRIRQKDDKYSIRKFSLRANNKVRVLLNLNKDYNPGIASVSSAN